MRKWLLEPRFHYIDSIMIIMIALAIHDRHYGIALFLALMGVGITLYIENKWGK